jgi:dihydroflavonol-4-reductase
MTILVTGATGLVGNNVVRLLLERGQQVRVLVRESADPRPLEGLDVERATGDVRDAESVARACRGAQGVIHAAGYIHLGWTQLETARAINAIGTRNVAQAAREAGARMVHVSTSNVMGLGSPGAPADEDTPPVGLVPCTYVVTKQEAERAVFDEIERGLAASIVNPGYMLGPWDWKPSSGRMLLAVAKRFMPVAPRGGTSVCDVRDVAAAILTALERGETGRRYLLGGENMTYFDLWRRMARVSGARGPVIPAGPLMRVIGGWIGDARARLTGLEGDLNSAGIAMSGQFHHYTSERARRELNYQPRPADVAIAAAWEWLSEHGYV